MPDIQIVDGPFVGRTYRSGEIYAEIPPQEASKFETVAEEPVAEDNLPEVKTKNKRDKGGLNSEELPG